MMAVLGSEMQSRRVGEGMSRIDDRAPPYEFCDDFKSIGGGRGVQCRQPVRAARLY